MLWPEVSEGSGRSSCGHRAGAAAGKGLGRRTWLRHIPGSWGPNPGVLGPGATAVPIAMEKPGVELAVPAAAMGCGSGDAMSPPPCLFPSLQHWGGRQVPVQGDVTPWGC